MILNTLKKLYKKNSVIYILLAGLCILTYGNILGNEFTVVDDLATFVNNEIVPSFSKSLLTFQIQVVIYSIFHNLFGVNPVPLHIFSISLHIINSILFFSIFSMLFRRKTAFIAAVLFSVHPVNTEAVTWISGSPYLLNALCINLSVYYYLLYKKSKFNAHLIYSIVIFLAGMLFIQTIWLVVIPPIIFIIEQFFIEKRINLKISNALLYYLIPLVVFGTLYAGIKGTARLSTRSVEKPMNQQSLKPVVEGAPYTVFTMSRLYAFPKTLMIYYDGNPVDSAYYLAMYTATLLYGVMIFILWKRNRAAAGIFILLIVLLAPTFSPIKVSWYLSERYLYYGTAFFCLLLALILVKMEKLPYLKYAVLLIFAGLTGAYSVRAVIRNSEFKNSKSLAIATMRTSPMSIRGYDDMGGDLLLEGKFREAIPYFRKTLTLLPDSNTAISNLGYIYIMYGFPQTQNDLTDKKPASELLYLGREYYKQQTYTNAFYYLYQSFLLDPNQLEPKILMAEIYIKANQYQFAEEVLKNALVKHPDAVIIYEKLAYIEFHRKNYDPALQYLNIVLKRDPTNSNVIQNIELVEQTRSQNPN